MRISDTLSDVYATYRFVVRGSRKDIYHLLLSFNLQFVLDVADIWPQKI